MQLYYQRGALGFIISSEEGDFFALLDTGATESFVKFSILSEMQKKEIKNIYSESQKNSDEV